MRTSSITYSPVFMRCEHAIALVGTYTQHNHLRICRANVNPTIANIIPTLRYFDASATIAWLSNVFRFEKHLVVPIGDGKVAHA